MKPDYAMALQLGDYPSRTIRRSLNKLQAGNSVKTDYVDAIWNYMAFKNDPGAEYWIDKLLEVDENHVKARLTKAALRLYQNEK